MSAAPPAVESPWQLAPERLRLAVDAAGVGVWEYNPVDGQRRWSLRCKELFSLPLDDAEVSTALFLSALDEEDRARWHGAVRDALDPSLRAIYQIEYRVVGVRDGVERWILSTGRAHFEGDRPVRLFGTMIDVTALRRAERERDLFLGMLGHDLRNPLQAIDLAAGLLRTSTDARAVTIARRIAHSAARMRRLIADLLDFARLSAGGLELQRSPVQLGELSRDIAEELKGTHPDRTITLDSIGDVRGEWDRDRIGQVVQNLVSNALTHGSTDTPVRMRLRGSGETVVLEVANQGPPIPRSLRPHLFDPFQRGKKGGGSGLGLYIAAKIVAAHQGSIVVDSTAEQTRFSVTLPRRPSV